MVERDFLGPLVTTPKQQRADNEPHRIERTKVKDFRELRRALVEQGSRSIANVVLLAASSLREIDGISSSPLLELFGTRKSLGTRRPAVQILD